MVHKGDLVVIGISVGVGVGIIIASLVFFGICWYRKRGGAGGSLRRSVDENSLAALPIRNNISEISIDLSSTLSSNGSDPPQNLTRSWWHRNKNDKIVSASGIPRYSYKDIQKATHDFTNVIGEGSFGPVYKATLLIGDTVAVKVLASNSKQGEREFQTEVSLLGRLHHRNLVNLVGYCVDKGQRMLIYEYMSNGSLANHLYNEEERALNWEERLQIALDISHGIEYLHDGAVPPVIHRDLKSANILLDGSMRAKVADFGLSKEESFDGHNSGLKGTYGYIDPAYISTNKFTAKSDIYSFGVILFELITAIHPHQNLVEYVNLAAMSPDGVDEILDKRITGTCNPEEVRSLASIANKCLRRMPRKRPSIVEVSQAILKIKQMRLKKEDTMSFAAGEDLSRMVSRIEQQQVELKIIGAVAGD